jgi:hypothetical protein
MINDIEIYKGWLIAKHGEKKHRKTAVQVAKDFGITRNGLYEIVRRIETGNMAKVRRCSESSRLDCLWEYKYKPRYLAIPTGRQAFSVSLIKKLIWEMYEEDKFPISRIASLTGKDRSTVIHHLTK